MDEKQIVIDYMLKHRMWSIRDEPILKSQQRTSMILRRLERQGTYGIKSDYVVTSLSKDTTTFTPRWIMTR